MKQDQINREDQLYAGVVPEIATDVRERALLSQELDLRPPETQEMQEVHVPVAPSTAATLDEQSAALFLPEEGKEFRGRWDAIQAGFVDEPRRAVEQAENLVAEAMKRLTVVFADERGRLEEQWDREDGVSTEDLRLALRRYRLFFGRLLSV